MQLVKIFEQINNAKLSVDELDELLLIFDRIRNDRVRNHLSFVFSDKKYQKAIPHLFRKIFKPEMYAKNGSLVHSLIELVSPKDIYKIIEILATQDYECRRSAFEMIIDLSPKLNPNQRKKAILLLAEARKMHKDTKKKDYEDSALHYIDESIEILNENED